MPYSHFIYQASVVLFYWEGLVSSVINLPFRFGALPLQWAAAMMLCRLRQRRKAARALAASRKWRIQPCWLIVVGWYYRSVLPDILGIIIPFGRLCSLTARGVEVCVDHFPKETVDVLFLFCLDFRLPRIIHGSWEVSTMKSNDIHILDLWIQSRIFLKFGFSFTPPYIPTWIK